MRIDRTEVLSWSAAEALGDQWSRLIAARSSPKGWGSEVPPIRVDTLWRRRYDQDDAHHRMRNQVQAAAAVAFPAQIAVLGTC